MVLGVNYHREDSPVPARCERDVAGRLALCMKRQVTHRRQQQSSAGWRRRDAKRRRAPRLRTPPTPGGINPKQGAGCPLMRSVRVRGWLPVPSETRRRQRDLNAAPYPEIRGTVHLSAQPWDPKGRRRRERSEQDDTGWFSTPSTVRELWNIARRPREELQPKESSQAAY